ncbi:MAG TPA: asparagine synthase (glutamine-hydrolyzing) [Polyangia bacterium]|nr:asparagine synthase (glutamine-hydrolyzing) [Polyangia bacterium]
MCGIVGIARFGGKPVAPDEIDAMVATLIHRGPDDSGRFVEAGVGIGMRRLSIIDVSPLGHQPMGNEDGAVQIVYNGEVYNFLDLRAELVAAGHRFRSGTDTEVLVHGYEQWGAAALVARLEGMFAFALLDRTRRRLFLGRDRFGIKPLYLRRAGGQLSFASEVRAFAADGQGRPAPDASFVGSFLCLGYLPSPATAFAGVTKLPPATLLEIDLASGAETAQRYYELAPARLGGLSDDDVLEQLDQRLLASVAGHLIADVPTGVFLSGGLDSSALTAYAARDGRPPPRTFSIGFSASDRGDETAFAAAVARQVGSDNVRIDLAPDALGGLPEIVGAMEDPLADSAALPLWHLCKGTRAHVTVALSGEGGDEVLGGYHRYFWGWLAEASGASALAAAASPAAGGAGFLERLVPARSKGAGNLARRAAKLLDSLRLPESARYLRWFELFAADERAALGAPDASACHQRIDELFDRARAQGLDPVQRLQYVDFSSMLLDNLLLKADKLSMAHSLEVRVPLLDRALVELGLGLSPRGKIGLRRDKPLLRRLLRRCLPPSVTERPKRGFEIPVDRWLREPATEPMRRQLVGGALVKRLGLSAAALSTLVARHLAGQDLGRKLFALLTLDAWAERFA